MNKYVVALQLPLMKFPAHGPWRKCYWLYKFI